MREEEGDEGGEGIDSLSTAKEEAHSALASLYEHTHTQYTHTRVRMSH